MKDFIAYPHCIIVSLVALTLLSGCFFETSPVPKGNQSATNNSATNNSPKTPQANSPKVFKSAQIRLFHLPSGVPENFATDAATKAFIDPMDPKPIVISDQGSIDKLVACFPGVGSDLKSPAAGGWEACGEIVFTGVDSTEVTVKFNDDLSNWSDGAGDFDIETPEILRGLILSSSKK
ncbi:hypothetical protein N9Y42_02770 [Mariniblastus sp.]|nr:hypothetical protein [Mariniblastus sp.]